ncbi:Serine proteinase stubble [Armadillidium vulgare]|nr:Serine proteinase stubble [Armadillidium vulgare]
MTIAWCGAVVLNERWVITAAHCAQGLKTENLVVRYGSHNVYDSTEASPIQERQAIDIVFHPEFDQLSKGHDIALIKVNEPVKFDNFVTPICLPGLYVGNLIGAKAIVSGWGKGESDEDFPMVLQKGDSGGPLQVRGDDGRWFLAGVTSSGFKCAKPNLPGLYTRASLYVPWILEHIKQ